MRSLVVTVLMFISLASHANNYYFSSSLGSDNRTSTEAQNQSTPFKSLNKLNSIFSTLTAGDAVLFKRGDVFFGSLSIVKSGNNSSPISFGAYGTGNKPVITGFNSLSKWYNNTGNVWETTNSTLGSAVNMVTINGVAKRIGRFPNYNNTADQGYLYFENATGNTSITDSKLSADNYTGGEVVIRKTRWVVDRNKITLHSGNNIYYTSQSNYSADKGFGYFIQNHIKTLDQEGEWYYKAEEKKLGIFTTGGSAALQNVQASVVEVLVSIANQSNLVFDNIVFTGSNTRAFFVKNSQHVTISNCDILFSGGNAVTADNTDYLKIENSTFDQTNNIAFNGIYCTNSTIRNNKINCTGVNAGMGDGDSGSYEALLIAGDNNLIEQNKIDSSGYIPVTFSGNNVTIKNNFISNYAFVKDDGGGIYTWNNGSNAPVNYGRKIIGNIVMNGLGAGGGTSDKTKSFAHGIYIDDNASAVEISSNTIANSKGFGLFIHNARDLVIKSNTIYNNQVQLEMEHDDIAPNSLIRNNTVTDNILFSLFPNQPVAEFKTKDDDLSLFGNFNNNYYCRPIDDYAVINTLKRINGSYQFNQVDLDGWKAMYGKDLNSTKTAKQISSYRINEIIGSNKFSNGSFESNVGGLYSYSPANNFATTFNNGPLDGGTLQLSFSGNAENNKGTVIINVGAVTAGKKYILRISTKASEDNKNIEIYLRKSLSPYTDLTDRKLAKIKTSRSETEFLFIAKEDEANASIGIDLQQQSTPVYLDNIQLLEANVTNTNVEDSVRFIYNPNAVSNSFPLNNNFIDVKNTAYSGSISINAFSSAILLNSSTSTPVTAVPNCSATGTILYEEWTNVFGNNVADNNWTNEPANRKQLTAFEATENNGSNYASRIRGYLCPPVTGNYTFWIAGDDATELWLSTDADPAHKVKIAYNLSWTSSHVYNQYASQQSVQIALEAGKKYYIEALHKQGGGGDNFSVAWKLPGGVVEAPIPGSRLSPYITSGVAVADQIIFFSTPIDIIYGAAPFSLFATSSSGLPVNYRIVSGPAVIAGNVVTVTGTGVITIEATQQGNANYNAAPAVVKTFTVTAPPLITPCSASGTILREVWNNVGGNNINDNVWTNTATSISEITSFEGPENAADNYASRISGYLCPPQTGNYTFWIAGDDATELWLSTNENPANKIKIAYSNNWTGSREWFKNTSQQSVEVYLEMGKKYYIAALHKEGGGGDNVAVSWKLPGGVVEAPIPGIRLSPFKQITAIKLDQSITFNAINDITYEAAPFALLASATSGLPVSYKIISGPATLSGNMVTMTAAGSVTIEADQAGNTAYNAANAVLRTFTVLATPSTQCAATGTILREVWNNVGGNNINDNIWTNTPTTQSEITSFEGPENIADNYASRIRGYICPPETGNYTFWIAGDDATELWLSNDDRPINKIKIAYSVSWTAAREWNKSSTQQSGEIYLEKGKKYYIEALHKEGAGGDNLAIAWKKADNNFEGPIPGAYLSPYQANNIVLANTAQTNAGIDYRIHLPSATFQPQLRVNPNPVKSSAFVIINPSETGSATVKLIDLHGRYLKTIYQGVLEQRVTKKIILNPENLINGIYFVKLSTKNTVITEKVIIGK